MTYAEKITRDDRRLDPARPAQELERRIRALTPHIGVFVDLPSGQRLGVRRAALAAEHAELDQGALEADGQRLLLGTASGALELLEVQPPGGRPMSAADYLRGRGAAITGLRPRRPATVSGELRCPRPSTTAPPRGRSAPPVASLPCTERTLRGGTAACAAWVASS